MVSSFQISGVIRSRSLTVRIDAGCDFADLFEVKDALKKKGKYYTTIDAERLALGYERDTLRRETWISATTAAEIDESRPGGIALAASTP